MKSPGDRKMLSITNANENIKIVMRGLLKSGRWDYAGEKIKAMVTGRKCGKEGNWEREQAMTSRPTCSQFWILIEMLSQWERAIGVKEVIILTETKLNLSLIPKILNICFVFSHMSRWRRSDHLSSGLRLTILTTCYPWAPLVTIRYKLRSSSFKWFICASASSQSNEDGSVFKISAKKPL